MNHGRVVDVLGDPAGALDAVAIVNGVLQDREARKRICTWAD